MRRADPPPRRTRMIWTRITSRTQRTRRTRRVQIGLSLSVFCVFCVLGGRASVAAQEPPAPQTVPAAQLQAASAKLGNLDYPTRTTAARTVRRAPASQAMPALLQAVAEHADGYVRYRALGM